MFLAAVLIGEALDVILTLDPQGAPLRAGPRQQCIPLPSPCM